MQLSASASTLLVIVLVVHVDLVRSRGGRGGGGGGRVGGGGRGSSAGRSSGRGSSSGSRGGGFSTFSSRTGIGSVARSSSLKSAAAGHITYQAGKGIIKTPGTPFMWNIRPYYWGYNHYQYRSGYDMCSMPLINSTDDTFNDVFFDNDTRPEMIVWDCHASSEYCCGYECCPNENEPISIWAIIGLLVGAIILLPVLLWGTFYIWYLVADCNSGKKEENENRRIKVKNQDKLLYTHN
uniref:CX domain-containing protein n=1 Tax=Plectus sambesii TaxID=2011161 RepID=A0A914WF72_9BILA